MGVSASGYGGYVFLAYHTAVSQLNLRQLQIDVDGTLSAYHGWAYSTWYDYLRTSYTPELVELHSSSYTGTLAVIYRADSGVFRYFYWSGSSWAGSYSLLDSTGATIAGGEAPAAVGWPDSSVTGFSASEKRTLALLPDTAGNELVYVLNYSTGRWTQLSLGTLGITEGKPFIAYRHQRQADGNPRTDFPGNFMIGRMQACEGGNCAYVRWTSDVSRTSPPGAGMSLVTVGDYLQNGWAIVEPGTNASLYSDSTITARAQVDRVDGGIGL